jgi:hypothetical protein
MDAIGILIFSDEVVTYARHLANDFQPHAFCRDHDHPTVLNWLGWNAGREGKYWDWSTD